MKKIKNSAYVNVTKNKNQKFKGICRNLFFKKVDCMSEE